MMPRVLGALMWDLAFPCITSAFCLIQLAFLQLTQVGSAHCSKDRDIKPRAIRWRTHFPTHEQRD